MYRISYVSDGVTTEYSFTFPFFQDSDVCIALNNNVIERNQYAVVPNEMFTGGSVIFATPPPSDTEIDIFRHITLSRVVDYQPTVKIDPEDLNTDFNFLLEAFKDLNAVDIDLSAWENTHTKVLEFLRYCMQTIEDKFAGGGALGLYGNLVSVLNDALPKLINDYGSITESADVELNDDYGLL